MGKVVRVNGTREKAGACQPAAPRDQSAVQGLDVISSSDVYPLPVFKRRAGLSKAAMREAQRGGLVVIKAGRRSYVCGEDFKAYLRKRAAAGGEDS